jgi:hypothetical protein
MAYPLVFVVCKDVLITAAQKSDFRELYELSRPKLSDEPVKDPREVYMPTLEKTAFDRSRKKAPYFAPHKTLQVVRRIK